MNYRTKPIRTKMGKVNIRPQTLQFGSFRRVDLYRFDGEADSPKDDAAGTADIVFSTADMMFLWSPSK